jgi:hypothetical protein
MKDIKKGRLCALFLFVGFAYRFRVFEHFVGTAGFVIQNLEYYEHALFNPLARYTPRARFPNLHQSTLE